MNNERVARDGKRSFPRCYNMGILSVEYGKNVKSDKHGSTPGLISLEPRVGSTWD